MDKRRFMKVIAAFFSSLVLFGLAGGEASARTQQIRNVVDSSLVNPGNAGMKQISDAIRVAGTKRGWVIRSVGPGRLIATLHIRSHMAEVIITHDTAKFSITYSRSSNLLYDKENGTEVIHRNYNSWIRYLQNDIRASVAAIP